MDKYPYNKNWVLNKPHVRKGGKFPSYSSTQKWLAAEVMIATPISEMIPNAYCKEMEAKEDVRYASFFNSSEWGVNFSPEGLDRGV